MHFMLVCNGDIVQNGYIVVGEKKKSIGNQVTKLQCMARLNLCDNVFEQVLHGGGKKFANYGKCKTMALLHTCLSRPLILSCVIVKL